MDTPQSAALHVICEGKASATREEWGAEGMPLPDDQWALATRVQTTQAHAQTAHQWFHRGDIPALLPLGGATGNHYAVVWSLAPERAQSLQSQSESDFCAARCMKPATTRWAPYR